MLKKKKIYPADVSKHNSNCEKQVTLLMIPNGERWHYYAVKKLPALLRGRKSKHHTDFYYLNCLRSCATKNKRESDQKVWGKKDFCNIVMPSEDNKLLQFNQF